MESRVTISILKLCSATFFVVAMHIYWKQVGMTLDTYTFCEVGHL